MLGGVLFDFICLQDFIIITKQIKGETKFNMQQITWKKAISWWLTEIYLI